MEVGVSLAGTLADGSLPAGWLHRTQQWLHENWNETLVGSEIRQPAHARPVLRCQLHPAASDVELVAGEHGRIGARARTESVGPGYHAHVCALLRQLGQTQRVTWETTESPDDVADPTGYYFTEDRTALERAMLEALQARARTALKRARAGEPALCVGLPPGHDFGIREPLLSPLGPRDDAWLELVATDPRRGVDIFPWWEQGLTAGYHLGRALAEMWLNVRWRAPIDDAEAARLQRVLRALEQAHARSPHRPYPWPEWAELASLLGMEAPPPPAAEAVAPDLGRAPLGYRRHDMRVELRDGWSVKLPGCFAERWEADETFCGWDQGRTVWFAVLERAPRSSPKSVMMLPEYDTGEQPVEIQGLCPGLICRAGQAPFRDDTRLQHKLNARLAAPGSLVSFTVVCELAEDEPWARDVIRSVRPPPAPGEPR